MSRLNGALAWSWCLRPMIKYASVLTLPVRMTACAGNSSPSGSYQILAQPAGAKAFSKLDANSGRILADPRVDPGHNVYNTFRAILF